MHSAARPLLLIGGGKMGEALLAGWRKQGLSRDAVLVVEPDPARRDLLAHAHRVRVLARPEDLPGGIAPATLVLAVKPQTMVAALEACAGQVAPDTLVLSIAAGKPIALYEQTLGDRLGVVRAMPNTPASVGRGVTVLCANAHATASQCEAAELLMGAVGAVHWVTNEDLLHAVTAVSGSGPAYVFHLIEALAQAGVRVGLPDALAMDLARGTVIGAGELARQSGASAEQLRIDVTSPGGTTAAALQVLAAPEGLGDLLARTVAAAALRSRELA